MIIRRLYTAWALLGFLHQNDPLACQLRTLLTEQGRFPTRRTWERRLQALPTTLPGLMGCFTWLECSSPGGIKVMARPWTAPHCAPMVGYGIKKTANKEWYRTAVSIPKPPGANRAGMAGGTAGSCTWRSPLGEFSPGRRAHPRQRLKGLRRCQVLALGAIFLYQLVLLYQHEHQK